MLATLTHVRGDASAAELRDRIALVQWLRGELAAVETLLTGVCSRWESTSELLRRPDRAG